MVRQMISKNGSKETSTAQDESSQPLAECRAAVAARMRWYRSCCLASNASLKPLLLGNEISASPPPLSSPSPPNASAFTVFRAYRVPRTWPSVRSLPSNPPLRPLLPPVSSSPPPPPPVILPEGDNNANATSIETLLLQATHAIAHVRRIRVSAQAQPQVFSFTPSSPPP